MATHILLIEDETQIRENVQELLTLYGYQVDTATNGREGISQALLQHPDLILCDIMMPEANGYQVLDAVRGNRTLANIPFIFLTAKTEPADIRKGMVNGADDYLTKPFTVQNLLDTITARLEREIERKAVLQEQMAAFHQVLTQVSAHEYNTCLNGIIGVSTLMLDQYQELSEEDMLTFLEMIKVSGLRLKRSLDNVQLMDELQHLKPTDDIYRYFAQGQAPVSADWVDEIVTSVIYRQGCVIGYYNKIKPGEVSMNQDILKVCLEELIDNAVKFSDPGQLVLIKGEPENEGYLFTITNNGQPFNPADIEHIAPYTQFDRKQYEQQGFGLGLAIVKRLLELNKGKLTIQVPATRITQASLWMPAPTQ